MIQPLYLWNVGFQLSFITVIGIGIGGKQIEEGKSIGVKGKKAFIMSLYASLFSYPIIAYYFYKISFIGIILNLIILPICGILVGTSFLAGVFSLLYIPVAKFFAFFPLIILKFIEIICTIGTNIPYSYFLVGSLSLLTIGGYYILILCASFYGTRFCNKKTILGSMVMILFSVFGNQLIYKKNTIGFLDVGQGDATVITTYDKNAIVIDGGGSFGKETGKNTGAYVVQPYLESLGIGEIDAVIATHFDGDHIIGIIELCENMKVNGVYISEYQFSDLTYWEELKGVMEKKQLMLYTIKEGDKAVWGKYGKIECLSPKEGIVYTDEDDNHGSLVLKYTYGGMGSLFMGDATKEDETIILDKNLNINTDLLKVGHHGSKNSSSPSFVEAVSPKIAIISAGERNTYGHPHHSVLETLKETQIYRTDQNGSIFLEISPDGSYEIDAVRERKSIYERIKEKLEK